MWSVNKKQKTNIWSPTIFDLWTHPKKRQHSVSFLPKMWHVFNPTFQAFLFWNLMVRILSKNITKKFSSNIKLPTCRTAGLDYSRSKKSICWKVGDCKFFKFFLHSSLITLMLYLLVCSFIEMSDDLKTGKNIPKIAYFCSRKSHTQKELFYKKMQHFAWWKQYFFSWYKIKKKIS